MPNQCPHWCVIHVSSRPSAFYLGYISNKNGILFRDNIIVFKVYFGPFSWNSYQMPKIIECETWSNVIQTTCSFKGWLKVENYFCLKIGLKNLKGRVFTPLWGSLRFCIGSKLYFLIPYRIWIRFTALGIIQSHVRTGFWSEIIFGGVFNPPIPFCC